MDWDQLGTLVAQPDNVPIVLLLALVAFYLGLAVREARRNDRLIADLEADPDLRRTHHRTADPYHPSWPKTVPVWPHLLKREFLAAIIVTALLIVWSIVLDAPLEAPANPNLTMNPAKAPWYFLGLQELLVYFDPWIAGVMLPLVILGGLMAIPYLDVNPLGNGYYTWKQRKFAIGTFLFGFLVLWLLMVVIGTFARGPGWLWFWPGETWDLRRVDHQVNRDLHELWPSGLGGPIVGKWPVFFFGFGAGLGFAGLVGFLTHATIRKLWPRMLERLSRRQYAVLMTLWILQLLVVTKVIARLAFTVKYFWVTPWFNV